MTTFSVRLQDIEDCFQGIVPSLIATCSLEGVPNVTEISIVHRVDDEHVALSRQFFNKTIANLTKNPRGCVDLIEPQTGRQFRLDLQFERTETEGELFDRMSARLEAVAAQEGMSKVFRLAAADICRVLECAPVLTDRTIVPSSHPAYRPDEDRPDLPPHYQRVFRGRLADRVAGGAG